MASKRAASAWLEVSPEAAGCTLGRVRSVAPDGTIEVEWPGSGKRPVRARILSTVEAREIVPGAEVLLLFPGEGPNERPVVAGTVSERIETPREVVVDGKRLVLKAAEEIELRCGQGSVTIRADGRVVVRGTRVLSRASGTNRIRGGNVQIN